VYVKMDDVLETPIINPRLEKSIENNNDQHLDTSKSYNPTFVLRRSFQPHKCNMKCLNYILLTDVRKPKNYEETCQISDVGKWELVIKDNIKLLVSNRTWKIIELPIEKKTLQNKWAYQVKDDHDDYKRYKV